MPYLGKNLENVTKEEMNYERGWTALEPGEYRFVIIDTDYKSTRAGDGMCLHIEMQCVEEGKERVKLRDFLTLEHPEPQTVKIAEARLKQIAVAVGHPNPDYVGDSEELHDIAFWAKLTKEAVKEYGDRNGFKNLIASYKPINGSAAKPKAAAPRQRAADDDSIPF